MSYDFKPFAKVTHEAIELMSTGELFVVDIGGDELWQAYLAAFPEGTNPIYRERTEHNCSCCRNFVRNYGNVVSVGDDGSVRTIWGAAYPQTVGGVTVWDDDRGLDHPYSVVASKLDELVRSKPIKDVFRTKELKFGNETTRELLPSGVQIWNHFHGLTRDRHRSFTPDKARGDYRASVQVFERGLEELTVGAIETVLTLILENNLYRGEEHKPALMAFRQSQIEYLKLKTAGARKTFVWANAGSPAARFKNTVIGTLVEDLSNDVPIEDAVRMFESKVAPTNYKRTTSLITPRMVQDAMKTIDELGLEPALQRRYARMSDITVNNVLWADHSTRDRMMRSPLENALMDTAVKRAPKQSVGSDIGVEEFVADVLPNVTSMEMLVKAHHVPNFVSLTAPVWVGAKESQRLFRWNNDFAWSYDGNITDSIKERVKRAGGNVTNAALRVSLAWFNYDDLDIHVVDPRGRHIYFADKQGKLDVDMNAGRGTSREPVENVSWLARDLADGVYTVGVHQYQQRETIDFGFQIEIENAGQLLHLSYAPAVKGDVDVCKITVKDKVITKIEPGKNIVGGGFSQEKWGIFTETFCRVETMLLSPNFWDGQSVGNKHWIFALDGCRNSEPTRGIYNEFLRSDLEKHRKVFEILGDKTKCPPTDEQISGLGFSSTRGDTVTVRVAGHKMARTLNIKF